MTELSDTESPPNTYDVEVSVVMPCLNEADTIETCIRKAQQAFAAHGINGEVVIGDNGSDDGSQKLAIDLGARVVDVPQRGYGSALMGGIAAARGEFVIMGDADDSYEFLEIPKFVDALRAGSDLVQGCRLPSGGGQILPGAMPFLHRWLGNPMLSRMAAVFFRVPIHDIYCGLRGFRRDFYESLNQRCTGMEFATEMIVKSTLVEGRISEVPITLHPDGRKAHPPHLRTFRDGWRTVRFFMLYSPRWTFFLPGLLMILLGVLGYAVALPGVTIGGATFDAHTLLFASLSAIVGFQSVIFAVLAQVYGTDSGMLPVHRGLTQWINVATLERMLIGAAIVGLMGTGLLLCAVLQWYRAEFGRLDYAVTMRWVIPGVTLTALAVQTALASLFLGILRMHHQPSSSMGESQ
ncbi:glycosyltransferase family 2 protein [Fuerstiella marisgermanici]|uniref:Undecaprenyl-phosphate 4-deoxy-4-formamido-L-arabinose transferase n=1 Tax=Fuerstiella marisgermanici TaxID=1891926 RepID=A0A1P8W9Q5_9PLAN|nr:glycosyltransferase family 2 protein [Fuerstiella marisgermanici]APZ90796.1 Undecaprenyl-phosphate 4-deoxy-4-formamido-L-arabinose transferase [Fuerstiella marisgermanici]